MSSAASANSHSRKIAIFGRAEVAFGQTTPVRVGHSQGNIERPDKAAVDEIPSRKRCASERNALTIDGGID
jgi:hypothetical protein